MQLFFFFFVLSNVKADKGAERDGKEKHGSYHLILKPRPRSFLWLSLYSACIMDGILFCVWSCLVTSNEQGRTGCFPRASSLLAPHFLTLWYQPPSSSVLPMRHHHTRLISARCPQHLCAASLPPPPSPPSLCSFSSWIFHHPQHDISLKLSPQPLSSLCGGLIFQLLQHSIQTDSPSLPH